jgi:hypothetical protein
METHGKICMWLGFTLFWVCFVLVSISKSASSFLDKIIPVPVWALAFGVLLMIAGMMAIIVAKRKR